MITAGIIKGPLPCPEKRIEKQSIYGVERKTEGKKEKKDKKETEKKREKIKEK